MRFFPENTLKKHRARAIFLKYSETAGRKGSREAVNMEGIDKMNSRIIFKTFARGMTACALLAFAFGAVLSGAELNSDVPLTPKNYTKDLRNISALTVNFFENRHFNSAKIDEKKCDIICREYLRTVDSAKIFFTQTDIDEFLAKKNQFPREFERGNLSFAFTVFNRMLERYVMYDLFARELLKDPAALYNETDTLEIDRKNAPWAKNLEELRTLWRKRLINELIVQKITNRAADLEKQEQTAKNGSGKADVRNAAAEKPREAPERRILRRISQSRNYYAEMMPIDVLEFFLNAVAAAYDPHTSYMTPATHEDFDIDMSLKLTGIGATLTVDDGYVKIVEIVPGSPSDKDGRLQAGDRITAVQQEEGDAVDVVNMPLKKVVRQIRGPAGTRVTLTVLAARNGLGGVPDKIQLTRAEVIVKDREASKEIRLVPQPGGSVKKIGVITLPSFYMDFEHRGGKCASADVRRLLEELKAEHVDGVVMDLRSNGGGSLPDCVTMAGLFLREGPMVLVRSAKERESLDDTDGGEVVYDGPLIVMVNRLSASASEIFAGAIRDYGRGLVVGDSKTHGKGSVQFLQSLDPLIVWFAGKKIAAGNVKVTNAKFYRVNGESTQLKGITPDIVFPSFFDSMDMGEDKLENPLPWDTITSAEFTLDPHAGALLGALPALREKSRVRVAADQRFELLRADIVRFKKMKEEKTISLNFEQRWKLYLAEKKIVDEQNKLFKLETRQNPEKKQNADDEQTDLYLDETLRIMSDLIDVQKQPEADATALDRAS